MISIDLIRNETSRVQEMLNKRGSKFSLKKFLAVDADYLDNLKKLEMLNARRNAISKDRTGESIERAKKLKQDISDLSEIVAKLEKQRKDLWSLIPNMLDERVPDGESDKDNVPIKFVGEKRVFDFKPKWHDEIATSLNILNIKNGVKVAGSGFYYWRGDGAKLHNALFNFALDTLVSRGFVQMTTPILAKHNTFFGTGYLPFAQDQLYSTNSGENLSLIGTSEQTLVSFHEGEYIDVTRPIMYTALTPCFRTEAGSYGKETKGIFRVHQFYKVEQIIFCKPEESPKMHEFCRENEELILQKLGIPYRVVNVCVGDLGAPASIKYDIEGWFPAYGDYRELTSDSNLLDYQTRRLNIRYKTPEGKPNYPHTISATGITERAMLAIIENYQTAEGDVVVPDVLVPYMGGMKIIKKNNL